MERAQAILANQDLPQEDSTSLPDSQRTFPDGTRYRYEVSGVEQLQAFEALIEESKRWNVRVHRVIAFVAGATLRDRGELRAFAELSAEHGIEVIAVPGPRAGWDLGRQAISPEGRTTGGRVRGIDNLRMLLNDYLRCFDSGLRGILVWDEGVLDVLSRARTSGDIPGDVVMKVSVFTGHGNPASIRIVESLGADSINPVGDLTRPMLSAIRASVAIPLDIYAFVYDSFGGMNRYWEAGEIARVASPCYFKIEPGDSERSYSAWASSEWQTAGVRERVRHCTILEDLIASTTPSVVADHRPQPDRPSSNDELADRVDTVEFEGDPA